MNEKTSQPHPTEVTPSTRPRQSTVLGRTSRVLLIAISCAIITLTAAGYFSLFSGLTGVLFSHGEPLGGDFIAFYTGGALLRQGISVGEPSTAALTTLYDLNRQLNFQQEILGNTVGASAPFLPFIYPPFVALPFLVLSLLPFQVAYATWVVISLGLYLTGILLLLRTLASLNPEEVTHSASQPHPLTENWIVILLLCMSYTPFLIDTIAGGQLSAVGIALAAGGLFFFTRGRLFTAGLLLSLLLYKAPLFLLLIIGLSLIAQRRLIAGMITGALLIGGAHLVVFGVQEHLVYLETVVRYLTGREPLLGNNLPSRLGVGVYRLLHHITPTPLPLTFVLAFFSLTLLALREWLIQRSGTWCPIPPFIQLITISTALSLQANNYDTAILVLPGIFWGSILLSPKNLSPRHHLPPSHDTFAKLTAGTGLLILLFTSAGIIPETAPLPLLFLLAMTTITGELAALLRSKLFAPRR
ncbi:DUF2029 domain-containing protein [bacterium]|nr:DUF2029 domain-containing protein [bacterium]